MAVTNALKGPQAAPPHNQLRETPTAADVVRPTILGGP
jgi:hypothetical protein